jgi:hypothetical protein
MATNSDDYGYRHRKARAAALEAFVEGTPCPICHRPMSLRQPLDLAHAVARALGGHGGPRTLAHRACNRGEGNAIATLLARGRGRTTITRTAATRRNRNGRRGW